MTNMCGVVDSVNAFHSGILIRPFPEIDGIFGANEPCRIADIGDGTSNTLIVGEVTGAGPGMYHGHFWAAHNNQTTYSGINGACTAPGGTYPTGLYAMYFAGFGSFHPGGCNFALADGSVAFLSQNIAQNILAALTTRNGPSSSNMTKYPEQVFSPEVLISGPP